MYSPLFRTISAAAPSNYSNLIDWPTLQGSMKPTQEFIIHGSEGALRVTKK